MLKGSEVKSIRLGRADLNDSFARIEKGELWLFNMHITPYEQTGAYKLEATRQRKLLVTKREVNKLLGKVSQKGYTLIPLKLFFSGNFAKIELAIAKSKRKFEKRESIKKKEADRQIEKALRQKRK